MFMSLSSTTRTRAPVSFMGGLGRLLCRRLRLLGFREKFRIEVDLCRFAHYLDLVQRTLPLHALGDPLLHLFERLGGAGARFEDVNAVARRHGVADLAGLELQNVR